jgi:rare lipoprotein A
MRALIVALACLGLVACHAQPKKHYTPFQQGLGTWYGKEQHGGPTASGERFNMHAMTAAHRSLPLGTRVRVTNKRNGKSVVVRINDRGPYGRAIIDLSRAAASKLDMLEAGVVPVTIEVMK